MHQPDGFKECLRYAGQNFDYYSQGNACIRSNKGKVLLEGKEIVDNNSSIIVFSGFRLASEGTIENVMGSIYSLGENKSYIKAKLFKHLCGPVFLSNNNTISGN